VRVILVGVNGMGKVSIVQLLPTLNGLKEVRQYRGVAKKAEPAHARMATRRLGSGELWIPEKCALGENKRNTGFVGRLSNLKPN